MNSTTADSPNNNDPASERARVHYNSRNAEKLFEFVLGSDTLNLGMYDDPSTLTIAQGMKKTTEWMAGNVEGLNADSRVLDIGAGYGPAARYLAKNYGCHVTCLNISEEQNAKNEALNKEQGLDHLITIVPGNWKKMPFEDASFDVAWTQDSFFHADELEKIVAETYRVLAPGGQFLLMDILQSDDCPDGALLAALSRVQIQHERIGSFGFYKGVAAELGFECINTVDLSNHQLIHYTKWRDEVIKHYDELSKICSPEFIELSKIGFEHWVEASEKGLFEWGLMHFRRP